MQPRLYVTIVCALCLFIVAPCNSGLFAQTLGENAEESEEETLFGEDGEIDEDALFGGTDSDGSDTESSDNGSPDAEGSDGTTAEQTEDGFTQEITEIENADDTFEDPFLSSEEVELGGNISAGIGTTFYWHEFPDSWDFFINRWKESFSPTLNGSLFFDARPSSDFRVFGKAKVRVPFTQTTSFYGVDEGTTSPGLVIQDNQTRATQVSISVPKLSVFELFSEFNWNNRVFFRMGKQTVNWGVGYFFSPADIINLTPIDVEDPEAEREGPLALKANIPIDIHNIDLYLITGSSVDSISDIGLAGRGQIVLGPLELGLGVGWQKSRPFKSTLTVTLPVEEFNLFAEALFSVGSERTFIERSDNDTYTLTDYDDKPFLSATAGGMYTDSDAHLNIMAQYFFNHQGYRDPSIVSEFYRNALEGFETVQTQPLALTPEQVSAMAEFDNITSTDFFNPGRHYTGLSVSFYDIGDTGLGFSGFWLGGFSDLSGRVSATISYSFTDYIKLSGSAHTAYGEEGDEFIGIEAADQYISFMNPYGRLGFTISATVGSGSF